MRKPTYTRIGGGVVNALRPEAPPYIIWTSGNEIFLTQQTAPNRQAGSGKGFAILQATQYPGRSKAKYYPSPAPNGFTWGFPDVTY